MKSFHTLFTEFQIMSICSCGGCRGRRQRGEFLGVFHGGRAPHGQNFKFVIVWKLETRLSATL